VVEEWWKSGGRVVEEREVEEWWKREVEELGVIALSFVC
jgi:hypothetical protein